MSFTVQPEKLHAYAEQMARQAGYVRQMNKHVGEYGNRTSGMQGALQSMVKACAAGVDWQRQVLTDMDRKLGDSASALRSTADQYKETDRRSAEEIDKTYPDGGAPRRNAPGKDYE